MTAIIFDTETTGLNQPEAIETAWIRLADIDTLLNVEQELSRWKPSKPIELGALATHHIQDKELDGFPPSSDFRLPPGVEYLIGHNIDYDWKVIGQPKVKRICTLALSRSLWPEADSHSQSAMLYLLEYKSARLLLQNAHSALIDVKNCAVILAHILRKISTPDWRTLWLASEAARIPATMPFGKHKGQPIVRLPVDYKRWLLGQPDIDPYLLQALKASHD